MKRIITSIITVITFSLVLTAGACFAADASEQPAAKKTVSPAATAQKKQRSLSKRNAAAKALKANIDSNKQAAAPDKQATTPGK